MIANTFQTRDKFACLLEGSGVREQSMLRARNTQVYNNQYDIVPARRAAVKGQAADGDERSCSSCEMCDVSRLYAVCN